LNPKPTVNIIGRDLDSLRGYGWAVDGRIVGDALRQAGFDVANINSYFYWGEGLKNDLKARAAREFQGFCYRFLRNRYPQRDINIFLERVPHQMFPAARRQVLIPNQEWFLERWKKHLSRFDAVICKTHAAEEIFSKLGCRTYFSSFSSQDKRVLSPEPKRREFLMMIGRRPGLAEPVIALWARHPDWPRITICGHRISSTADLANVRLIRDYVPDEEILRLQNDHLFHLAVTAAEGFGHKLNEGMSCGAIVITTDAPPMNELIGPDRGLLVKWNRSSPKALGTEYHFDVTDLERVVRQCLALKTEEADSFSRRARGWFESNDRFFKETLPKILLQI
jgi:glycosyltransferase involved in cell wall biosynthesis